MTAKKASGPSRTDNTRKKSRRRRSIGGVIATAMIAGSLVNPTTAKAALPPSAQQSAHEAALKEGTPTALKQFLQKYPTSKLAEPVFMKLAAMCGGGRESDPDCEGTITATPDGDPPGDDETFKGGQPRGEVIY